MRDRRHIYTVLHVTTLVTGIVSAVICYMMWEFAHHGGP